MPEIRFRFIATGQPDVKAAMRGIHQDGVRQERQQAQQRRVSSRRQIGETRKRASAEQRAVAAQQRATEKWARAEQKIKRRRARLEDQLHARESKKRERRAIQAEKAAARERVRQQRSAERRVERLQRRRRRRLRRAGVMGAQLGLRAVGATMGVVGGLIGGAARQDIKMRDIAAATVEQARRPGMRVGKDVPTQGTLEQKYRETAARTGLDATDIATGVQEFVSRTGDLSKALKFLDTVAVASVASSTKFVDVMNVAVDNMQKFGITEVPDMQKAMASLIVGGKAGAVELRHFAKQFQRVAAKSVLGGFMQGPEGVAALGGMLQIARQATGNPAEARTAVKNVLMYLGTKGKAIEQEIGGGFRMTTKNAQGLDVMRPFHEVLAEIASRTGGTSMREKLEKIPKFLRIRGMPLMEPILKEWEKNVKKQVDGGKTLTEANKEAEAELKRWIQNQMALGADWSHVQEGFVNMQKTTGRQLSIAWEEFKNIASRDLVPAVIGLVQQLPRLMPAAELAVGALTELARGIGDVMTLLPGGKKDQQQLLQEKQRAGQSARTEWIELHKKRKRQLKLLEEGKALPEGELPVTAGEVKAAKKKARQATVSEKIAYEGQFKNPNAVWSKEEFAKKYAGAGWGISEMQGMAMSDSLNAIYKKGKGDRRRGIKDMSLLERAQYNFLPQTLTSAETDEQKRIRDEYESQLSGRWSPGWKPNTRVGGGIGTPQERGTDAAKELMNQLQASLNGVVGAADQLSGAVNSTKEAANEAAGALNKVAATGASFKIGGATIAPGQ